MTENNIENIEAYLELLKIDIDILKERINEKEKFLEMIKSLEENNKDIELIDNY